ncbi:chemotaxis protein CheW [Pelagicoccus sp. SDUM812005]|uniref:chemotaxis protein CheW n=1 Tax=Pelagicoccus sp. SDUM812005 TaxID=3041257 RepID=UPI00280FAA7C|nr:chemotaxis protein CheW [Pelagicoccus sp. SDUM812005]MDQ8181255.1 chemotaxis protein CheW [Pelagicoccus sp. SDUM812005]
MSSESFDDFQAELVKDFLLESSEGLETFDQDLLVIEKGEFDPSLLNQVFRVVHTIKGTAGCLGFSRIESIAHTGENVLSLMRDGELESSPDIADALLKLSDALRAMLEVIESSGSDEMAGDYTELKAVLDAIKNGEQPSGFEPPLEEAAAREPESVDTDSDGAWGFFDDEPEQETVAGGELAEESAGVAQAKEESVWGLFGDDEEPVVEKTVQEAKPVNVPAPVASKAESIAGATVRVDVELLDCLMNMVGELVLSRNQLLQLSYQRMIAPSDVSAISQRFNQVTTELQQGIMKTRMQQIGTVWGKYPRIVRDLASDLGKRVELETFGADTELDRTIIEAIKDPLTHIIRNAVDHGIESPEVRKAAGKSESAQLLMRAFHEAGQVNIEIVDDGAGIDGNKICGKALEKGLIDVEEAGRLSEREKINLIFLPGFSTAEKLSNVSGRGVGMDVVKTNIEKIGGSVEIHSVCGEGTTLRIKIPLTLAIVAALVVKSGDQRFAIPQVNLVELVRIKAEDMETSIETVYDTPVFRLRGKLLPLVFLDKFLKLPAREAVSRSSVSIAVLRADSQDYGLVVDVVSDTEEIVVKPLGKQLADMPIYAGATIMGDGSVAIILDAVGVASRSGVLGAAQKSAEALSNEIEEPQDTGEKVPLILFSLPGWENLAVPLEAAERLEEFDPSVIETSGGIESVHYRGGIMQLLRLGDLLGFETSFEGATREQVIVYKCGGRYLGIVVGENRDIVEQTLKLENIGSRPYIKGSALVNGRITDLVDVDAILVRTGLKELPESALCHG